MTLPDAGTLMALFTELMIFSAGLAALLARARRLNKLHARALHDPRACMMKARKTW